MTDIPLDCSVQCEDGSCGKTTHVIVNPVSHLPTHFALRDETLPDNPTRLVPTALVREVTPKQITLDCARTDVEAMRPFVVEHMIQQSPSGTTDPYAYSAQYVFNDTAYASVPVEELPKGTVGIVSGMDVIASDGDVGKLDQLVLDPKSGEITHIRMHRGHLWGRKDIVVPLTEISYVTADSVHLKLDKKTVKELPDVETREP